MVNEGKIDPTLYLCARVWLDLNKPLVRVVPITLKERMKSLVQYEKLHLSAFFADTWGMRLLNVVMESTAGKATSRGLVASAIRAGGGVGKRRSSRRKGRRSG